MTEPEQDYFLPDEWNDKVVFIFNEATGTMLDLYAGQSSNGTPIIGWEHNGSGAQQWRLQKAESGVWGAWVLRNVAGGTVLDLYGGEKGDGGKLHGYDYYRGNPNQEWLIITKEYNNTSRCIIQNTGSFTVVDMAGGNRSNGTPVHTWNRSVLNSNQLWRLQVV